MAFRIGQVAPQGVSITDSGGPSDYSTATSAQIFAELPNGTLVTWTAFISAMSSESITVNYQFLAGDVALAGFWRFYAKITGPFGVIQTEPFSVQCFPPFEDAPETSSCCSPCPSPTPPGGVRVSGGGTIILAPGQVANCDPGGGSGGGCTVKASPLTADFSTYEVEDGTGTCSSGNPMSFGGLPGWSVQLPGTPPTYSAAGGYSVITTPGADVIYRADAVLKKFNITNG